MGPPVPEDVAHRMKHVARHACPNSKTTGTNIPQIPVTPTTFSARLLPVGGRAAMSRIGSPMKIELKNIKVMSSLSEETNCYSASLYVDGKKIGDVSNRGHGGPDNFYGDRAAFNAAEAWVKANMPPLETSMGGDPLEMDMELLCGTLLEDHLLRKDLKSSLRRKVLFVNDGLYEITKGKHATDTIVNHLRKKHGGSIKILNTLPFDEAFAIYKEQARV